MSITLTPPGTTYPNRFAAPSTPNRVPLTVAQYYLLFHAGLLPERCELLDGEIIEKLPQTDDHVASVRNTARTMRQIFGEERTFSQTPMVLGVSDEPEPDVFITALPDAAYPTRKPNASAVVLVIEASYSTLDYDRGKKASRYALADVADYWVVDVENRRLFVYRNPANGAYTAPTELTETDTVSPLAAPNALIAVKDLLP